MRQLLSLQQQGTGSNKGTSSNLGSGTTVHTRHLWSSRGWSSSAVVVGARGDGHQGGLDVCDGSVTVGSRRRHWSSRRSWGRRLWSRGWSSRGWSSRRLWGSRRRSRSVSRSATVQLHLFTAVRAHNTVDVVLVVAVWAGVDLVDAGSVQSQVAVHKTPGARGVSLALQDNAVLWSGGEVDIARLALNGQVSVWLLQVEGERTALVQDESVAVKLDWAVDVVSDRSQLEGLVGNDEGSERQ
ncbi:predicted protein [Clavispora lusitaniae ATCC 42720]|uniref:Uncharacterized protein n=1 Tax=Clavispora lusitaniae (strain ATCC 42720) TaxID=306902 RepID=C4Y571_CLAL4|nr:uncharacterized protein CLUG_03305 [Clavispora lusitaniae ATCC 42720]EEQ39177.1 predicted protein [Clavispora lusitaniae ATCC 42720]